MDVLDLFSGIGGFSLGLEWAGMSTKAMCEKDPYCRKVLAKHWPGLKIHEDIRDLDGKEYANSVDVVAGGFPCQPFSQAGRRKGRFDDRHLWPEMFRVIKESKPRWVIGENVFGFINMALDDVQSDLESEHYEVRKFVLPAVAVDARHRRDRCFIIANSHSNVIRNKPRWGDGENGQGSPIITDHGEAQFMANSGRKSKGSSLNRSGGERIHSEEKKQWSEERDRFTNSGQALAHSDNTGDRASQSRTNAIGEEIIKRGQEQSQFEPSGFSEDMAHTNGERKLQQRGTEQEVGGWSGDSGEERISIWEPEPGVGRVADGVPGRVDRLKGLGNAVVPQLIQAIGEIVIKADREIYS